MASIRFDPKNHQIYLIMERWDPWNKEEMLCNAVEIEKT